jgi:hydroxyacylglutathione hydrolase
MLQIHQFPCLQDNYGFLVHDADSGETTTIDTPDAAAILRECDKQGWRLTQVWNTHWHPDHAGGNAELKEKTSCLITGPREVERIGLAPDRVVAESDGVRLGEHEAVVFDVGGHTLGHIAYYFASENVAFVGDSIFSLGCGRMFEGTAQQFWSSLQKISALPDDATLYCAHEYTAANARFALSVDPDNEALKARAAEVERLRAEGKPTVPMKLGAEKAANPFLRADRLKTAIGMAEASDWEAFGAIRRMKDSFR